MTIVDKAAAAAQVWGATPEDWRAFISLGLCADLLPVVSNPAAVKHPISKLEGLGKTPSRYLQDQVVGIAAWTSQQSTPAQVAAWGRQPDYGICVQTRGVRAIDIDIADPGRAAEAEALITLTLGQLPARRRSNSGKCLLVARVPGDLTKRRIQTKHAGEVIELLATGQQFVAVGTHPSGVRYEWDGGLPAEIPTISMAELDELWAALQDILGVPGGSTQGKPPVALTKPRSADDADDAYVPMLYDLGVVLGEQADGKLNVVCPWKSEHSGDSGESESTYLPAGLGGRAAPGFKCQHAHCLGRTAPDFLRALGLDDPADDFEVVTVSEAEAADAAAAAIRNAQRSSVPRLVLERQRERAKRIGREGDMNAPVQRVMTGSEMLEDLVLVEEGSRVAHISEPRSILPFEEKKRALAGSVDFAKSPTGKATKVHRLQLWLEHPERKTVRCQTFAPGRPAFCQSPDNVLAHNLWVARSTPAPNDWQTLASPFFEHVAYLVPDAAQRERFLDWIAHIEQDPGTLPSTHYLLVAKQTGIGRNWLAYALARVFAGHTALGFGLGAALRSGFNGALSRTLLAVVDELHEGRPGGAKEQVAEQLKSMLTETTRKINPKYGREHVEFNCTRFLMFSNHEAALPLADNDRRVVVLENPDERRSADYYRHLYALLDHPDLGAALAEAFKRRDISSFNPGEVAPMTAAKARTIRAGRSEVEQAVRDVATDWPAECITSSLLTGEVSQTLGGKTWNVQSACVAAGLVKYPHRVRVAGVPAHVWLLRNADKWLSADSREVGLEAKRGQDAADAAGLAAEYA